MVYGSAKLFPSVTWFSEVLMMMITNFGDHGNGYIKSKIVIGLECNPDIGR